MQIRFPARNPERKSSSMVCPMDPKLNRPFDFGWKREVVHRTNGNAIDIYYRTPDKKKLRSKPEVCEYLKQRTRLKIENFMFKRKPLGLDDSKEICRNAY
ncbi:Hypothetical protein CINCED_3A017680 [Cinara cedri]|uniref:MBD domain-containing protein n=1 Tax=Cinara cedri TaxID=506608 RepID=A0A5E4NKI8_9HEMI|nr:Hypothetical protein CINCED_3A017680 [Cinara cedri]